MIRTLFIALGLRVQAGPFKGLKYRANTHGSALPPKLMGCYEKELHPFVEQWKRKVPKLIVDIGAAEGYYAVGFAKVLAKQTRVVGFEASSEGQKMLAEMIHENQVEDQVEVRGLCSEEEFCNILEESPDLHLIVDIEGGEFGLFSDRAIARIGSAHIILELHAAANHPEPISYFTNQFQETHRIHVEPTAPRSRRDFPLFPWRLLSYFSPRMSRNALDEKRTGSLGWMILEPKGVCS